MDRSFHGENFFLIVLTCLGLVLFTMGHWIFGGLIMIGSMMADQYMP
jgi:hypothetical protein